MSQLSLIIETQNEVPIDEIFLEQCKADNEKPILIVSRMLSSNDLKLNRNHGSLKKGKSPQPFSSKAIQASALHSSSHHDNDSDQLSKIATRLEALEENQKRIEERIGKEFFELQNQIFTKQKEQSRQFEEVKGIKQSLQNTKKSIGELLNNIAKNK